MAHNEDTVVCQTPTPGKKPTRIPSWKYQVVRAAILKVVPVEEPGLPFRALGHKVESELDPATLHRLGSLMWHVTVVKLDMEVNGELVRLPGPGPQRLCQTKHE